MGVVTGCGCKEVFILNYLSLLLLYLFFFTAASLLFVLKMFFVLVPALLFNYILCIKKFFRAV